MVSNKNNVALTLTREIIMKWHANSESLKPQHYEINHDPFAGFYLYVFEGDKCIQDYLQDTLEIAMECAWEDYSVPKNLWKKVRE